MTSGTSLLAVGARATTSCDLLRGPLVIGPDSGAHGPPDMITPYFDGCVVDTRWVGTWRNIAEGVWDTMLGPVV